MLQKIMGETFIAASRLTLHLEFIMNLPRDPTKRAFDNQTVTNTFSSLRVM